MKRYLKAPEPFLENSCCESSSGVLALNPAGLGKGVFKSEDACNLVVNMH